MSTRILTLHYGLRKDPMVDKPSLAASIVKLLGREGRAMHASELASRLGSHQSKLQGPIARLVDDGVLVLRPGRRYRLSPDAASARDEAVTGTLAVHARGFAFVRTPDHDDNVYIAPEAIGGAMHDDSVSARVISRSSRGREGEVIEVLSRGRERICGVVRGRGTWLDPDDARIRSPIELEPAEDGLAAPRDGLAAVVTITRYPEYVGENPRAKVLEVLGTPGTPDVEVRKILLENSIDETHPPEAEAEAEAYGDDIDPDELARREDLRNVPLVTIDPVDARDHDDAAFVQRDDEGRYDVWIAIADVSYFVRPGSALDANARERANSVYLPDRAVPMLPRRLSSELCSLVEGVDRLCVGVQLCIGPDGSVLTTRFVEGVMRSAASLTYEAVARALGFTTEQERDPRAEERRHELQVMWDLASTLRKRRMRRGAMSFDLPEARIDIDPESRAPVDIVERRHDPGVRKAYRLVEELMILANEAVAQELLRRGIPAIYRVHGAPDPDKLARFGAFCQELDIPFELEDAEDPKKLSKRLRKIAGHDKAHVLYLLLLRAMQQAQYDVVNIGHYGLASQAYLHFTSPIRRYPDLAVHRMLRASVRGQLDKSQYDKQDKAHSAAALQSSKRERVTMEAERQINALYAAMFMRGHVGDQFDATVMGIGEGGVFTRIDAPFVDVFVPMTALGLEDYAADELGLRAVGARSGDRITVGDTMKVQIEDVSLTRRSITARRIVTGHARATNKRESRRTKRIASKTTRGRRKGRGRGRH